MTISRKWALAITLPSVLLFGACANDNDKSIRHSPAERPAIANDQPIQITPEICKTIMKEKHEKMKTIMKENQGKMKHGEMIADTMQKMHRSENMTAEEKQCMKTMHKKMKSDAKADGHH